MNLSRKRTHNGEIILKNYQKYDVVDCINQLKSKLNKDLIKVFPPLIFVHQLYSLVPNRTYVDKEIVKLKNLGILVTFKLRVDKNDISIAACLYDDIKSHILKNSSSRVTKIFVSKILPDIKDVAVDKDKLRGHYRLVENQIKTLVRENILVIKDVGSFWLSFPKAGEFVKSYTLGRRYILRALRLAKYKEILELELLKRKLPKKALLGMEYYISDLVGCQDVLRISSTSGNIIRLNTQPQND